MLMTLLVILRQAENKGEHWLQSVIVPFKTDFTVCQHIFDGAATMHNDKQSLREAAMYISVCSVPGHNVWCTWLQESMQTCLM